MNPFHLAPDSELGTETRFIKLVLEVIKLCILMKERGKLQSCSFLIMCAQFGSSALCRSGNSSKGCTSIKAARAERVKTLSTQSFSEKCAAFCLFTGTCCCHQAASFVFRRELWITCLTTMLSGQRGTYIRWFPTSPAKTLSLFSCQVGDTHNCSLGSGDSSVVQHQTYDWKVVGSSPGRSSGIIFFSRVSFLFWLLFGYPFHPRVTAVARKRSRSFLQKCRWQVTAKHMCRICILMWPQIQCYYELVHSCMVYTEHMLRWQQFSMAPAMQWPNSAVTTSGM